MFKTLPRRFFGSILLLALLVLGVGPARATHLLGGEMSYRYLDANGPTTAPFRYEITVTVYSNGLYSTNPGSIAPPPPNATVTIYNRTTGASLPPFNINRTTPSTSGALPPPISPAVPAGCTVQGPSQPFYLCKYIQVVNLPVSFDGYYATFTLGARNAGIANLSNSGNQNMTLYVSMAPPLISNRSPVFSDTAVAIVCQNDTTISLNNAVDADGDRLAYSFGTPYSNVTNITTTPPTFATTPYFNSSYSSATPFGTGPGNFALLNASTGVAKYGATTNGLYVVAVDVQEYRNINGREVLIGTTRRDLQLVVSTCPTTPPPVLPSTISTPRSYTIEEGQSLSIPITATQASTPGHPLVLTANSVLLDGSGPFNTTFNNNTGTVQAGTGTGTATASGTGTVTGTFVFNSACGNARATPYDIAVTVKDNGCGGKIAADVFRITVTRAAGPNAINGPATVCDPATVRTYTAAGPVPTSYNWTVRNGTISSGQGTNAVNVTWNSANTTGTLVLRGISSRGCPTDSVVKTVDIRPLPALTVTAAAPTICLGGSTTLTVAGQAGLTYVWTGGGLNSTSTTVTVTPTATTTYTVTGTDGTCNISNTVTVTVTPPPTANAGADRTICPGVASTPLGGTPIAGATYAWSPATGLSSTTVANPTVTLPNTTNAPIVQIYTLTVTVGSNCSSVGTVRVTVNPAATANAGPALSTCSGVASASIGTTALTGYTYSWSPATGLSSATAAQPTVTLPNTTGAPITQTYTVTATDATGCSATSSVVVTVNPAAVATPGPAISFCSGTTSAPLGGSATPVAGTTYSWSPTTGLSNPNILNPTATGTNTTGAPITTTYTLTATTANGCVATGTVVVTINPAAVADAGLAKSTCPNVPVTIGSGTAVAGTTYAWSPTTGLSSASVLTPTVTLPNLTGGDITQTYTLTATTAQGCTATSTVVVTIVPAAVANAGGPALAFCSGESRILGGGVALTGNTYTWSPSTGLNNTSGPHPTVTLTNTTGAPITTTYTLTVTTPNGCIATSTIAVTVNPAAVAQAGVAKSTCSNVPVAIGTGTAVAGTTYAWTPTTGLSSASVLNPTVTLPNLTGANITQTYTLTATTANGCTATSTVVVTVNPAAVAQAGPDKATCSNVATTIGAGTAVTGTTYTWSPATGLSSASVLNPTVTLPNTTGANITQQYILLATTSNGCFQRDTVIVTVNPAAVAVTGANQTTCSNNAVTLGAAPVAGYTYSWSPATGLSSASVANPTFTLANTTNTPIVTTFTLTATTANGCVATGTVTVTVNPASTANAGPAVAVCDGKRVTLGTVPVAGYTYSWSPATNLSSATVAQPVLLGVNTGTTPITRTYTLTATTASGCVSTSTVVVTINPRPAPESIVGPASVCPTVTGIAYSVPTPAGTAYTWLVNGGTIATGQGTAAITVNWGPAQTGGYVKVFRLNAQGCSSDTTTLPIVINPRLQTVRPTGPGDVVAVAPLPRSVCQADGPYTYTSGSFANGSTYGWTIIGGTQVSTFQNTVTVNWAPVTTPTIGKIVVTETSNPASGVRCLGTSDTLRVLINPSPRTNLTITAPARVCQGSGPVTFALPGGFTGSTYSFILSGTTLVGTGSTRTLNTLPAPGNYTLTVQETTSAGCAGPLYTAPFTVNPTPATPVISGSGFVCNVAQTQQYAVANPTPGASYQWTIVGGTITSTPLTASTVTVRFNATGPYSVSVQEVSASPASCPSAAATRTVLFDSPGIALTLGSVDIASNNRIVLTLRTTGATNTPNQVQIMRRVAGSGAFVAVGQTPVSSITYTDATNVDANANTYEYRLDLTNGCGNLISSSVVQTVRLVAVASPGTGGRNQGSVALSWNAYAGATVSEYIIVRRLDANAGTEVLRVPGNVLQATISNTDGNATASGFGFEQKFRVIAFINGTPLNFTSNSNETTVQFSGDTKVYNIITPNRDGQNDVLVIDNIALYPGNTFTVFNRWGREVYSTTNYQNNWGDDPSIAAGQYFYLLKLPNGTSIKNWFEVVK
ncbi:gliding motility-associated C-terminal domain-containing protein [Hymenobacter monticola]|uniref:Gliding motility-associated C-terminal domain-containing protein n=1 Tax=Hymenobacter monticola TaxID=1705399 RepID=A0ABY4B018_9BACT|nr:gliding motility-associated C-terminal domain-containing protein [Hymenobacter monticola]UOE32493.1 gliding motility-associated C-terminal domain-containing protein [Hymenobacter monticola]